MENKNLFSYSVLAAAAVTGISLAALGVILVPESSRSDYFWYRLVWTEILNVIFWGGSGLYLINSATRDDSTSRLGGIAPSVSIATALYAVLSFLAMAAHSLSSGGEGIDRMHMAVQVILLGVSALTILFLSMSRAGATSGLEFDRMNTPAPKHLHDLLAFHEASLQGEANTMLKGNLKQLREAVNYSLHQSLTLAQLEDYQRLAREIQQLCQQISELPSTSASPNGKCLGLNDSVLALKAKVKFVAEKQLRS